MLNASVLPSFSTATTITVDRWTGEDRRNPFALRFLCVHQPFSSFSFFFFFYEGNRGVTQTKRVRDSISPLFFFFLISHFRPPPTPSPWPLPSHPLPVDRRWGVRDRGRQRQYFTAAAQSSSAGTQYLQPTAMQQWQICLSLCLWVWERETEGGAERVREKQRDKGRQGKLWHTDWNKRSKIWGGQKRRRQEVEVSPCPESNAAAARWVSAGRRSDLRLTEREESSTQVCPGHHILPPDGSWNPAYWSEFDRLYYNSIIHPSFPITSHHNWLNTNYESLPFLLFVCFPELTQDEHPHLNWTAGKWSSIKGNNQKMVKAIWKSLNCWLRHF